MTKKQTTKPKEYLGGDIIASSIFKFEQLKMDKDLVWLMKLSLFTILPQTFREYKVVLSLNEEPWETKIEAFKRNIEEAKSEASLFPDERKKNVKGIEAEIAEVEDELEDMRNQTPTIEFAGFIVKLEYKDGKTIIVVTVPGERVNNINSVRDLLKFYKIELIRE